MSIPKITLPKRPNAYQRKALIHLMDKNRNQAVTWVAAPEDFQN